MNKWIYYFATGVAEGSDDMQHQLGGKGAGLAAMSKLKMPVPPGFTITTEVCNYYYEHHDILPLSFHNQLQHSLQRLEKDTGKLFGGTINPLLLSVRSGAVVSMPGMMDSILNLGMNDEVCNAIINQTQNKHFAFDCYRRFLEMYGSIVLKIPYYLFEDSFELNKTQTSLQQTNDIVSIESLEKTIDDFKKIIIKYSGQEFPTDPYLQLQSAIEAVLRSWKNDRAITYRTLHNIPERLGTAVNIQSMVFGNTGNHSATGVVFTRCPSTGEKKLFGEFLINAQGEDIVAGTKTPMPIMDNHNSMQTLLPSAFQELQDLCRQLELHYRDPQDIEFTVENGKLYLLQTRSAKRTTSAAIKIAVDMVQEKLISKTDALMRIEPESLNQLLHSRVDYSKPLEVIAQGLPASPGAATGIVVFSTQEAELMATHHKVILVRNDTSPEDIKGIHVSTGIATARGGMTSHAAVVTRGLGKPCICGISGSTIDETNKTFKIGDIIIKQGDEITIDGTTGKVFLGRVPLVHPVFSDEFITILGWADEIRDLKVRANAETTLDAKMALKFGAQGIGLCRTEHMFFDADKIPLIREIIVAPDVTRRKSAIARLLPLQIEDFKELFRIMNGLPVNIRLLDPPLHEFLPTQEIDKIALAKSLDLPLAIIQQRLHALHEVNPMLGHRGCRLGISYPEIYQMQVRAILGAIQALQEESTPIPVMLELMIPLISNVNELKTLKLHIQEVVDDFPQISAPILNRMNESTETATIHFTIGTMIELPRAALQAGIIAEEVEYFSFGTNDLTQTTYGISRDDVASFLPDYLAQQIFPHDPFIQLDEAGVGELINIAVERGRLRNPKLKLGVCGEHAGNPQSIRFFHKLGLDYISCSPYRIPIAIVAAAQAKILGSSRNNNLGIS
ncbi:Pyruvate, phosphate dikinase [Candidatus Trichorickettsia mobilis]|uniref:Pyruvate, phosphate dikinase n=1 Tax=Candidatus Trichorickettsia mobilis TaxID=1346319 RepID=A0ABZ0UT58_9RICK|nr:pyruvate, phosphate dikinase [Candidatus Trichorickettsia mobilis]WPY01202.1 Pyruvate, phosphate dikinase [Candidatus Trichorickettsia mobilis]